MSSTLVERSIKCWRECKELSWPVLQNMNINVTIVFAELECIWELEHGFFNMFFTFFFIDGICFSQVSAPNSI